MTPVDRGRAAGLGRRLHAACCTSTLSTRRMSPHDAPENCLSEHKDRHPIAFAKQAEPEATIFWGAIGADFCCNPSWSWRQSPFSLPS
jgi:hypothetical protein